MHNIFTFKSLKDRTVRNKFNIILGLIIIILVFGLVNFWFSMKVMSSIRSYVGGEGLWSKGQKEAVNYLVKYSSSRDPADYAKFQAYIKVPLGDHQARLELNKPHPNPAIVKHGFVQGGNNPKDVGDLTFLYRRFRHVSYVSSAIQYWTDGDAGIQQLIGLGQQIQDVNMAPLMPTQRSAKLAPLLDQVYVTDNHLTVLENNFSATLSNGSRSISTLLTHLTMGATLLLGLLSIAVSVLIGRAIIRLDQVKSEFISIASHQLRTPLTVINWYTETLMSPKSQANLTDVQRKQLSELFNGSQRMTQLISDLLSVSSLELGTYKTEVKSTDIKTLVNSVLKDVRVTIGQKQLNLTTNFDPHIPKLNIDPRLLTVALQNIVSNSVKYTPEHGNITIEASIKKDNLLIKIADSGIGIPANQQSQIFTKLFRADNAKKLDANHTGLGLYIAKAMVERLEGTIWFDSVENQGTNFYVRIPMDGGHG